MRSPLAFVAAAAAVPLLVAPAVAQAADSPVTVNVSVSDPTPRIGESVRVEAQGYDPFTLVRIKVDGRGGGSRGLAASTGGSTGTVSFSTCAARAVCRTRASGTGVAEARVTVVHSGPVVVTVSGTGADGRNLTQTVGLSVQAPPRAAPAQSPARTVPVQAPPRAADPPASDRPGADGEKGVLSETGSETGFGALTGSLLVLLGAVALHVARYRGRHRFVFTGGRHRLELGGRHRRV